MDSEFTAFRVSKTLIYGRMLTAGSPSFNDISAVDGLDEADFVEILWSGTQLESPKIADMALVCRNIRSRRLFYDGSFMSMAPSQNIEKSMFFDALKFGGGG